MIRLDWLASVSVRAIQMTFHANRLNSELRQQHQTSHIIFIYGRVMLRSK